MQRSALVAFTALALAVTGCGADEEPADPISSTSGVVSPPVATAVARITVDLP